MIAPGPARGNPTIPGKLAYLFQLRCEQAFQSTEDRRLMRNHALALRPPSNDGG